MTNLCISSLPNPLSVSLAWGNAEEKLTQICDMWLPIGNGSKLGTSVVWVKSKQRNLVMVCTGELTHCKIGPDPLEFVAVVATENLRDVWSHYCKIHIKAFSSRFTADFNRFRKRTDSYVRHIFRFAKMGFDWIQIYRISHLSSEMNKIAMWNYWCSEAAIKISRLMAPVGMKF